MLTNKNAEATGNKRHVFILFLPILNRKLVSLNRYYEDFSKRAAKQQI